jgi:hypothetical protein
MNEQKSPPLYRYEYFGMIHLNLRLIDPKIKI